VFAPLAVIPIPLLERDSELRLDLVRAATRKAEAARAREWERKHGRQADQGAPAFVARKPQRRSDCPPASFHPSPDSGFLGTP